MNLLKRLLKSLIKTSRKQSDNKKLKEMEEDFQIVKEDLDFLYETVFPQVPSVSVENVPEYTQTIEIPEDIYKQIYKYSENKNYIFMGIS